MHKSDVTNMLIIIFWIKSSLKLPKFLIVCAHDTKNERKKSGWYQKDAAQPQTTGYGLRATGYGLGSTVIPPKTSSGHVLLLLFIR